MMTLRQLCRGLTAQTIPPLPLTGLCCHSKQLHAGDVFVALRGRAQDGHEFLAEAVRRGALALIVERAPNAPLAHSGPVSCPVIVVADTKRAMPVLASRFFGEPASGLRMLGVTGTNGKTTTAYLLKAILESAGHSTGLLGTVAYEIGGRHLPSVNTTPGALELQRLLAQMVEQGLSWCAMEVSSHALDQGRIDGVQFDAAIWTCLGSDHMDYHKTREHYAAAKRKLFEYLKPQGYRIINADDDEGRALIKAFAHKPLVSYGVEQAATVSVRVVSSGWSGMELVLSSPWGAVPVHTPLVGRHNVLNIAAAASACLALEVDPAAIRRALDAFGGVPGRMERVPNEAGLLAVIDYAHTTDALRLVLLSMRELVRGRVLVVFGCGGDRDQTKRPAMGLAASELADHVVLTSDNPRSEDPMQIIHQIQSGFAPGFREFQVVADREQAILTALSMARPEDAVLIAGKGHESYQIFDHVTVPFSDRDVVAQYFAHTGKVIAGCTRGD